MYTHTRMRACVRVCSIDDINCDRMYVKLENTHDVEVAGRLRFYRWRPKGITGISAVIRDTDENSAKLLGHFVQVSKNWHDKDPPTGARYAKSWLSLNTVVRVPPQVYHAKQH